MAYLPIFLDVTGRKCLVIGGGDIAHRKVISLLEAGAEVMMVSPTVTEALAALVRQGLIRHERREYAASDMEGAAVVYAATDNIGLHQRLYEEAAGSGIPINVADVPALCTFIAPAVLTRGSLKIAVSTSGASPSMAKRIVEQLERLFGPEYGVVLEVMRAARRHLKTVEPNMHARAMKLSVLAASRIPEYLREGDIDALDKILLRDIGVGLEALGVCHILKHEDKKTGPEEAPTAR